MSKRAIAVLAACFCTFFVSYSIRYGYGILLTPMLPALEITKTEAGVIFSSYFIAYTVLSPIIGLLGDRYDIRVIMTVFTAILGIGTFLMSMSSSVPEASFYFTIAGIGASACWAPVMALAQRWASAGRRGTILAVIDTGSSLGIIWMGVGVPLIILNYGWEAGWMTLGALGLVVAMVNYILVRDYPRANAGGALIPKAADKPLRVIYSGLLHNGRFWMIGIAYLTIGFSILIPFTFLSTYAVQELDFSYEAAARFLTIIGLAAFAGKLVLGALSDKIGRLPVLMICKALVAIGTLGMAFAQDFVLMAACCAVYSFGYGALWSLYAAAASDYFSKGLAGSIVGLWTMLLGIGSTLSPVVAGWVADTTGTLANSFIVAAAASLVGLVLLFIVWKRPGADVNI